MPDQQHINKSVPSLPAHARGLPQLAALGLQQLLFSHSVCLAALLLWLHVLSYFFICPLPSTALALTKLGRSRPASFSPSWLSACIALQYTCAWQAADLYTACLQVSHIRMAAETKAKKKGRCAQGAGTITLPENGCAKAHHMRKTAGS